VAAIAANFACTGDGSRAKPVPTVGAAVALGEKKFSGKRMGLLGNPWTGNGAKNWEIVGAMVEPSGRKFGI
jgi:hypothetical protein